jgi:hypothetical protein
LNLDRVGKQRLGVFADLFSHFAAPRIGSQFLLAFQLVSELNHAVA